MSTARSEGTERGGAAAELSQAEGGYSDDSDDESEGELYSDDNPDEAGHAPEAVPQAALQKAGLGVPLLSLASAAEGGKSAQLAAARGVVWAGGEAAGHVAVGTSMQAAGQRGGSARRVPSKAPAGVGAWVVKGSWVSETRWALRGGWQAQPCWCFREVWCWERAQGGVATA